MVFDLEMDPGETGTTNQAQSQLEELEAHVVVQELKRFLQPASATASQLAREVASTTPNTARAVSSTGSLADSLTQQGYLVRARRAVGGGEGATCLHNLRHEFLTVLLPGEGFTFIVDPHFAEQFEIAKPTDRYSALLACLPAVLVIPEEHIQPLVTFLCAEMSSAFKASSAVLPPWRQASSMLTKWQPRKSLDVPIVPGTVFFGSRNHHGMAAPSRPRPISENSPVSPTQDRRIGAWHGRQQGGGMGTAAAAYQIPASRQVKPMVMEPTRVYGGFGTFGPMSNLAI